MHVAIIGSGISSLSTIHYFNRNIKIDLYESNDRMGGHTHTHSIKIEAKNVRVDTGFIVLNDRNYPNLLQLFDKCDVDINKSNMSYSFSDDNDIWCSKDFFNIKYFLSINNAIFFKSILKFNSLARKSKDSKVSLSQWLKDNSFSEEFINHYILPMSAAIWSTLSEKIKEFPAGHLFKFFDNHGLLNIFNRPQWYSVSNGSESYINKILEKSKLNKISLNTKVKIKRKDGKAILISDGKEIEYDFIIFGCNTNAINEMLADSSEQELNAFNKFKYSKNSVVLHQDESFMPKNKSNWSSWNSFNRNNRVYLTYWMNNLQNLTTTKNLFVTIGDINNLEFKDVHKELAYEHIIYDSDTLEGQRMLQTLQGKNNLFFTGAYLGYGFHEDGVKSGLNVSNMLNSLMQ